MTPSVCLQFLVVLLIEKLVLLVVIYILVLILEAI